MRDNSDMRHNNNFDALRLIAAFMVLVSHQFALSGRHEPLAVGLYTFGTLGVVIFFSISGFLVAASWTHDPRPLQFAMRRFLRIWPALAVAVISLAVIATIVQPEKWWQAVDFVRFNLVFVRDGGTYFTSNPIAILNGPLWTIPIEVFCYVAFAILALCTRRYLPWAIPVLLVAFAMHVALLTEPEIMQRAHEMLDPTYTPWFCALFLVGSWLSILPALRARSIWLCVAGLVIMATGRVTLGLLLFAPPILIAIGLKSWPFLRRFDRFGDLSYGVYLWAWPVQETVIYLIGKQNSIWVLLAISAFTTLLLALASWHLVEKRALKWKPSAASYASRLNEHATQENTV